MAPGVAQPGIENGVNELLHRKRGEQFRHQQNVLNSRAHISSSHLTRNKPTLPSSLTIETHDELSLRGNRPEDKSESQQSKHGCSGPGPPKSWVRAQLMTAQDVYTTPAWRADALSLLFSHLDVTIAEQRILPLSVMCLLPLITSCTISELRKDVLPYIPSHLRKEIVRYTAVHHPLHAARLFLLYEDEGHSDAEIIVVGPATTIRDDYFIQPSSNKAEARTQGDDVLTALPSEELDWESDDSSPKLLQTFAAVSIKLSMSTILTLPPTITHLVLVHLKSSIALHRLPQTCPLLTFLDLSYNDWLEYPSVETLKSLDRVDWNRWSRLRTLGWRKCFMSDGMLVKLNTGRWDDMTVIQ